jgi:putative CocE/NonD family hydrolase
MRHLFIFIILFIWCDNVISQDIDILLDNKIKLRDNVLLNATIYKPHNLKESLPVIFVVTPYTADRLHARGKYFAESGYVFVIIDSRGRGASEGEFDPFMQEAKDGFDIVEFLSKQKYCNGKIAMWGASYCGFNQWATIKEQPTNLKTIVPVACSKAGVDFPGLYNISDPFLIQWLAVTNGKAANFNLFTDMEFWMSKFHERYMNDLPYTSLDSLTGSPSSIFQKWLTHPYKDEYLKSMAPTQAQYSKINVPILSITGCYDGDQYGTLSYYKEFMQYANTNAKNNFHLIIGPWDHSGTVNPSPELGGLVFGNTSLIDMNELHRQWYNYILKDSVKPDFLKNNVAYFVTNKDVWKYVSSLDEIGKTKKIFYLNNFVKSINSINVGSLQKDLATASKPLQYIYNPLDKTNGIFQMTPSEEDEIDNSMTDSSAFRRLDETGVIYQTPQFENETEVSGFFELKVYIETDVKDVDIRAEIYEVKADGTCAFMTSNTVRARFKDDYEKEQLLIPNTINVFDFKNFAFISRAIEKGSTIRIVINSPNNIMTQKNYCSGGVVAKETAKDAKTAHVKIYSDKKHPSFLTIPIVETK